MKTANIYDPGATENDYLFMFNGEPVSGTGPVPTGTIQITENGQHDVSDYATADVNVPQGITPSGSKSITENGTYDVTQYASAVVNVPQGSSGYTLQDIATKAEPSGAVDVTGISMVPYGLNRYPAITKVYGTLANNSNIDSAFADNNGLTSACIIASSVSGNRPFGSCPNLVTAVLITNENYEALNLFNGCTNLETADLLERQLRTNAFYGCTKCGTIILRTSSVTLLENVGVLSMTPFKSGGAGGDIYIPKQLYDHLGDGTALDYKANANWGTVDGYGTITWHSIEGSYYETHYADGTLIGG